MSDLDGNRERVCDRLTWDELLQLANRPPLVERGYGEHGWREIRCLFHDDRKASASLSPDRRTIKCHGACDQPWGIYAGAVELGLTRTEADAAAMLQEYADRRDGIVPRSRSVGDRTPRPMRQREQAKQQARPADPRERPRNVPPHARIAAEYPYASADGGAALKVRWEWAAEGEPKPAKTFRWFHVGDAGLHYGGVPEGWNLRLYREERVGAVAQAGGTIYLTEGEKCADALNAAFQAAGITDAIVTTLGKEKDLLPEHLASTAGAGRIVVLADSDTKGRTQGQRHAKQLCERYADVRYLDLHPDRDGTEKGFDVADWLEAGHTIEELIELIKSAPITLPSEATAADEAEPNAEAAPEWPNEDEIPWHEMGDDAYQGLAGELVRAIAPGTEADPAGMLITLLTMFGSAVGPNSHMVAGHTKQRAQLYSVLVGGSSTGRKGTSLDAIVPFFVRADHEWLKGVVCSGFLSGEAFIAYLSGDLFETPSPYRGQAMVIETEFGRLLAVNNRDGSTTSHNIRDLWDKGTARAVRRAKIQEVHDAYLCIVGHIVPEELAEKLTPDEIRNGFGNRCLYICVRRRGRCSDGGYIDPDHIETFGARLRSAIDYGREGHVLIRTARADARWKERYDSEPDVDGLMGSFTARRDTQINRLSLIYALLDKSSVIDLPHLKAAEAVWQHSVASISRRVQAELSTDERKLLKAARDKYPKPVTAREIGDLFSGHRRAKEYDQMIGRLVERGLVASEKAPTRGRSALLVRALSLKECGQRGQSGKSLTTRLSQHHPLRATEGKGGASTDGGTLEAPQDYPLPSLCPQRSSEENPVTTPLSASPALPSQVETVSEDAPPPVAGPTLDDQGRELI